MEVKEEEEAEEEVEEDQEEDEKGRKRTGDPPHILSRLPRLRK